MYPSYLEDRQKLGFRSLKDLEAGLSGLVSRLGIPVIWITKKTKKTIILIFLKNSL